MDAPVEDEELLRWSRAEAVHEHGELRSDGGLQVAEDPVEEVVGDLVGRLEGPAPRARLAVDPHPDLHLAVGELEVRVPDLGKDARRHRDAHAPHTR
jgi:hypothetical protein